MTVSFKRLVPEAVLPAYAHPGDAGMDLCSVGQRRGHVGVCVQPRRDDGRVAGRSIQPRPCAQRSAYSFSMIEHGLPSSITLRPDLKSFVE